MIEGRELFMSYRHKLVLKDVSLCVRKGEIVGIAGPNGVGKTTLIRILAGITIPKEGEVVSDGGGVFALIEQPSFYTDMTGRQNVEYYLSRNLTDSEIMNAPFDIGKYLDITVKKYSMGMRQKLALWLVSLTEAEVLLLDEPAVSLDIDAIAEMEKLLIGMKRNKGILVSSHDLRELQCICDRVLILKDGNIVSEVETDKEDYAVRIRLAGAITEAVYKLVEKNDYAIKENEIEVFGKDDEVAEAIAAIVRVGGRVCEVRKAECYLEQSYQSVVHEHTDDGLNKEAKDET